jgi:hypothetical protein
MHSEAVLRLSGWALACSIFVLADLVLDLYMTMHTPMLAPKLTRTKPHNPHAHTSSHSTHSDAEEATPPQRRRSTHSDEDAPTHNGADEAVPPPRPVQHPYGLLIASDEDGLNGTGATTITSTARGRGGEGTDRARWDDGSNHLHLDYGGGGDDDDAEGGFGEMAYTDDDDDHGRVDVDNDDDHHRAHDDSDDAQAHDRAAAAIANNDGDDDEDDDDFDSYHDPDEGNDGDYTIISDVGGVGGSGSDRAGANTPASTAGALGSESGRSGSGDGGLNGLTYAPTHPTDVDEAVLVVTSPHHLRRASSMPVWVHSSRLAPQRSATFGDRGEPDNTRPWTTPAGRSTHSPLSSNDVVVTSLAGVLFAPFDALANWPAARALSTVRGSFLSDYVDELPDWHVIVSEVLASPATVTDSVMRCVPCHSRDQLAALHALTKSKHWPLTAASCSCRPAG